MLKIGLVGRGRFGKLHEQKWLKMPDVEYVGYHDPLIEDSIPLMDLINQCDAVDIVTPPDTHYVIAKKVLSARKHCFIEKPICTDLWEAVELAELADKNKVVCQVGHIELFNKHITWLMNRTMFQRFNINSSTDPILDVMIHDLAILNEDKLNQFKVQQFDNFYVVEAHSNEKVVVLETKIRAAYKHRFVDGINIDDTEDDPLYKELLSFITSIKTGAYVRCDVWQGVRALNWGLQIKSCLPWGTAGYKAWEPVNIYPTAIIGNNVNIGSFSEIGKNVVIGNNTRVGALSFIPEGVVIEEDCFIGPRCTFANDLYPPSGSDKWLKTRVKKGAKLGAGVCVLPGITIGEGALVGMGSVVTKDVEPHTVVAGNPAKVLKQGNVAPTFHKVPA